MKTETQQHVIVNECIAQTKTLLRFLSINEQTSNELLKTERERACQSEEEKEPKKQRQGKKGGEKRGRGRGWEAEEKRGKTVC